MRRNDTVWLILLCLGACADDFEQADVDPCALDAQVSAATAAEEQVLDAGYVDAAGDSGMHARVRVLGLGPRLEHASDEHQPGEVPAPTSLCEQR